MRVQTTRTVSRCDSVSVRSRLGADRRIRNARIRVKIGRTIHRMSIENSDRSSSYPQNGREFQYKAELFPPAPHEFAQSIDWDSHTPRDPPATDKRNTALCSLLGKNTVIENMVSGYRVIVVVFVSTVSIYRVFVTFRYYTVFTSNNDLSFFLISHICTGNPYGIEQYRVNSREQSTEFAK